MAENTGIEWCDHTFNPWWGCTPVSPACDHCYAEALDKRRGQGSRWGPHNLPERTKEANWRKVRKWNEQAEIMGRRFRVFCGSVMDWCDKNAPEGARDDLWQLIRDTPNLDWLLLTKRATLIRENLPDDWGDGYPNVWLGVTAEDKEYGYPRIDALREIPARIRFLSIEPLLEDLDDIEPKLQGIDWVIVGGESGVGFRRLQGPWVWRIVYAAANAEVAFFFKQWGGVGKSKGGCILANREWKEWPLDTALKRE